MEGKWAGCKALQTTFYIHLNRKIIITQHNYIKLLAAVLLLGVLPLTLSSAYAVVTPVLDCSTVTADNLKPYASQVVTIGKALSEISTS